MDFYKKFSNLKVSESLFKEVKFYITGSLPEWIIQVLLRGGAKQVSHINDFMTHLIAGSNPDENEIGEVKDIYDKPVVIQLWVVYSAKCDKLLPADGFSPDSNQLFSGVKASVSKLGIEDSNIIWGLITYYGGKCTIDLDHTCTHLVVGKPEGIKYKRALEKTILIVTPDWIADSIFERGRKSETYYHPKLLNLSHPSSPITSYQKTPIARQSKKEFKSLNAGSIDSIASSSIRPSFNIQSSTVSTPVSASVSFENKREGEETRHASKSNLTEKSLFDSLIFSDDDDDDDDDDDEEVAVDGGRKSLLEQLKSSQQWKQSSKPPIPFPSSAAAATTQQLTTSTLQSASQLTTSTLQSASNATTSCIEAIPPISITLKNISSVDSGIFPPKEQQNKTILSNVNISTPSISITSQSASAALLPSSLAGTLATSSSNSVGNKEVVSSSISNTSSIISTSEVDISFISKQALQTSNTLSSTALHSSQPETGMLAEKFVATRSTSSPIISAARLEQQLHSIHTGKPLSKFIGQSQSVSQVCTQPTFSTVYSSLPPFSSTQSPSLALNSPQRQLSTSAANFLSTNNGQISTTTCVNQMPYTSAAQQVIMTTVRSPLAPTTSQSPGTIVSSHCLRPEVSNVINSKNTGINVSVRPELINSSKAQGYQLNCAARSENKQSSATQIAPPNVVINNSSHSASPNLVRSELQSQITSHVTSASQNVVTRHETLIQNTVHTAAPNNNLSQIQQMGMTTPAGTVTSLPSVTDVVSSIVLPTIMQSQSVNQSPVPVQLIRQGSISIVGSQGQPVQQGNNSGVTISSTASMAQQQVPHFGAIPGAVVRLPAGVTHQQLQMMSDEERQRFLEQLHRTQMQAQRANPRPGKPVTALQYKSTPPGTMRYPSTVVRAATHSTTQQGVTQQQSPLSTSSTWPQSSITQSTPILPGSPSANFAQSKIRTQTPTTTVSGWHSAQPQQQQPQFTATSQGTLARVVVGQPGWQQQPPVQQVAVVQPPQQSLQTTQNLLQVQQLHAQQLRQHFPNLNQQEAQQLIQTIPTHLRELQARDNAGRYEYLTQLDPKERQVVNHFYLRRHQQQLLQRQQQQQQQQQQLQAQQQAHLKIGVSQHSPNSWQQQQQQSQQAPQPQPQGSQFVGVSPHARPIPRTLTQGYTAQTVVSPGQSSPHVIQGGQLTPLVSPLASPHGHSPIQRPENGSIISHPSLHGSCVAQSLANQQNLVNPKTKTALANLLTNRLSGTVHQGAIIPQGTQGSMEVPTHIVHKQRIAPEGVQAVIGPSGEQVVVYQRQTLANITGTLTNNIVRPPGVAGASSALYPRTGQTNQAGPSPIITSSAAHYPTRPHFHGHDINTMLPRELCMVGCVFYIADYYSDIAPKTLNTWKIVIQQHGGEVVNLYDSVKVTHVLCQHQKSPMFQQAVRENKRCITIYWVNDILIRGKMAPPWQAIHLPTPYGTKDKPMKDMLVSISGFENEERTAIKIMLLLAGAKYTGYFSKHNHLLICKKFEGAKVSKARDWKRSVVNGAWLSEVLLGQNTPPLVYLGTRYQHYLDDPLRIDPSLASHLFNAWKLPISVSKESVEKAKAVRELALRKRKSENDGDQDGKRTRIDLPHLPPLPLSLDAQNKAEKSPEVHLRDSSSDVISKPIKLEHVSDAQLQQPKIMLSSIKNKDELEKKILALGGTLARTNVEMTHLVMGQNEIAPRTVKLMCAISCAHYIVSALWLNDCHKHQRFIDEDEYKLNMPEYENIFNFSLQKTIKLQNRKELFTGKIFYLTPSVVPGRPWLKEIIVCAGGNVDNKRKSLNYIKEVNKEEKNEYICIAAEADVHLVSDLVQEGFFVYNSEFIMVSIMKQEIDFKSNVYQLSCIKEE